MIIEYLGHSCFFIKTKNYSVVTDPFDGIGYKMKKVTCDYALVSHLHFDHSFSQGLNAGRVITQPNPIFQGVKCYHDDENGRKRGQNTAFYFDADGMRVLHLGDLGEKFSEENAKKFKVGADILFIPVGGNYTITGKEAAQYAKAIGAKVTIPMHFKTDKCTIDIAPPAEFLKYFPDYKTAKKRIEITKDNLTDFSPVTFMQCD
ncbi:MAG: MBL fold metallo-hydrolase [Christensenellaceae bacterium]|nr:MBL fold metallo-hydrolase [Christensenellaceae bacterium]MDD6926690.1 MBL fold metallo-hydrolase [bacterium]MDY2850965.1 MBL fold metallo-hydrolase [Christensenellaceae bacterium]